MARNAKSQVPRLRCTYIYIYTHTRARTGAYTDKRGAKVSAGAVFPTFRRPPSTAIIGRAARALLFFIPDAAYKLQGAS